MINDEKRREVAARLREVKKTGFDFTWCKICMVVCGPECPVGCDEDEMAVDAAKRLADLIDRPTCHISETDHEFEDSVRCDRCRTTFNRPWEPFKYCPNCGAVITDD